MNLKQCFQNTNLNITHLLPGWKTSLFHAQPASPHPSPFLSYWTPCSFLNTSCSHAVEPKTPYKQGTCTEGLPGPCTSPLLDGPLTQYLFFKDYLIERERESLLNWLTSQMTATGISGSGQDPGRPPCFPTRLLRLLHTFPGVLAHRTTTSTHHNGLSTGQYFNDPSLKFCISQWQKLPDTNLLGKQAAYLTLSYNPHLINIWIVWINEWTVKKIQGSTICPVYDPLLRNLLPSKTIVKPQSQLNHPQRQKWRRLWQKYKIQESIYFFRPRLNIVEGKEVVNASELS